MPFTVAGLNDTPRTTVADLVANPTLIPTRILERLEAGWLSTVLLRDAGDNPSGIAQYDESTPLFLATSPDTLAEFSEIPVGVGQRGTPRVVSSILRALAVRVSEQARRKNKIDVVNQQITQLVNSMLLDDELALRRVLTNPMIPTIPAAVAWTETNARIRHDISRARQVIADAKPAGAQAETFYGFEADTLAMSTSVRSIMEGNDEFGRIYGGDLASEAPAYTGRLPRQVMGLDPYASRTFQKDRVLVVERGTVGFYQDTRALEVTELYPEGGGGNGGPTESWRVDATQERVRAADQPLAACWITGVQAL